MGHILNGRQKHCRALVVSLNGVFLSQTSGRHDTRGPLPFPTQGGKDELQSTCKFHPRNMETLIIFCDAPALIQRRNYLFGQSQVVGTVAIPDGGEQLRLLFRGHEVIDSCRKGGRCYLGGPSKQKEGLALCPSGRLEAELVPGFICLPFGCFHSVW